MGVGNHTTRWVGWPGSCIPEGEARDGITALLRERHASEPVWVPKDTLDLYYNGFCNAVLWQLFHYVPVQMDFRLAEAPTLQQEWAAYQAANEMFADAVLKGYHDGEVVWIQDYHLMLLPDILKQRRPTMKVGFFLHTPFPSSEIYRTLPFREELLRGVLKADLIGFHTYDYVRHFISSCTRVLGLEGNPYGVEENGALTRVAAFPIGINPHKFETALKEADVAQHVGYLKHRYAGLKVMLGVDRLDMIKGIPQKLLAFEKFLEEYSEWRDKVVLVQIAVPSRLDVPEYQQLRSQVHEIVGRINGRFGTLTHVPIHHLDRKLSFKELCALYAITDVALITSLRDGMNLVSYEFVACQAENHGVLVLSEFAGAAQSLGAGSILVNPWNIDDMTTAIHVAVGMSPQTRKRLWKSNFQHVSVHTAQTWGDHFLMELHETCTSAQNHNTRHPPPLQLDAIAAAAAGTQRRLIVLGYNAALKAVSVAKGPQLRFDRLQSGTSRTTVDSEIMQMLRLLAADSANVIVIISGATAAKLCAAFASLLQHNNVWLAAENGTFMRPPPALWEAFSVAEGSEWVTLYENLNFSWVKSVEQVFEYFSTRTPRSVVETRETSVVWNYKLADYEFGKSQAQDMLQHLLTSAIGKSSVDVVRGARSLEVRVYGVNKGISMSRVIDSMSWILGPHAVAFDLVLCIGHFMPRDESIFSYFEGKDIVNVDASGVSRDFPPAGTAVADVLATINPGMQPAADPAAEPPPAAHVPRSRVPSLGSRAVSHIWTVDSFDESAGVPADRATWGGGASMHHSGEDVRRVVGTSPPRPDSPTSPTIPPPVARDAPNPGPLQRPLTRSRSSLAHAPAVPFPPSRIASPQFPNTSVPGGLVVAMHEPRMVPIPRGLPGGPASAAMRECEVFGVSPSGYATLRAGQASGWTGAAAQDARMHALERRSASGSLYQEAATSGSGTPKAGNVQLRVFPPAHLFTVTMGRSRSLARFFTEGSEVVSQILRAIVNPEQYQCSGETGATPQGAPGDASAADPAGLAPLHEAPPAATVPPDTEVAAAADLLLRGDHASRLNVRSLATDAAQGERAPSLSGSATSTTRLQVAQTLMDVCDSYDSATSLLAHAAVATAPAATATAASNAADAVVARIAGTARAAMEGRKSLSTGAPPPTSLSSMSLQGGSGTHSPVPFGSRVNQSAPAALTAAQPLVTAAAAVAAATVAAAPQGGAAAAAPPEAEADTPPSTVRIRRSEFADASPNPGGFGSPVSPRQRPPRRSISSSGIPHNLGGGDGGRPMRPMVGVRSWEPRAHSMQLSAQMTAAARGKPGDDRSTLFDAMGRPVPLAHAYSTAAADAPASVARRSSLRVPFGRGESAVDHSFESTYAPEYLPGLSSLPLPHVILPGIRSEGDLLALTEPRGNRMASFDLTPQYRSVRAATARQLQLRQAVSMGSSAPGAHACVSLAEHAGEEDPYTTQHAQHILPSERSAATARSSGVSTGTETGSSASSYLRSRARGDSAMSRLGVSMDGSAAARSSASDRGYGGRAVAAAAAGGEVTADSGLDFVLANPGRIVTQVPAGVLREGTRPVPVPRSHAISDLQVDATPAVPPNT